MEGKLVQNEQTGEVAIWDGKQLNKLPGRLVTNEQTGGKALWDGKNLTPVKIDIDPKQPTAAADQAMMQKLASPQDAQAQFTQARQQSAIQEPAFQKLAGATIPTIAAGASMLPGVGPLAGAAIQAGGTALNQVAGFEPYDAKQIALSGAIPLAATAGVKAVKGATKAAGKLINPGVTRTAGVEAGMESMDAVPNTVTRAYSTPASKGAYAVAAQQGPVPIKGVNTAVMNAWDDLTNLSNPPHRAVKYLENLSAKYAGQPAANYDDLMTELQVMRQAADKAFKQKDVPTGRALMQARTKILDEMDKVSPALREANAVYRREQAVEQIAKVLSNPRPDVKLGQLLINDDLVRGAIPKSEAKFLEKIADEIATMGTQASPYSGVGAKFLNFVSTPIASAMASEPGRYLLRQTFKDGKVTQQGLAIVAQFMRAYEAQNKGQ